MKNDYKTDYKQIFGELPNLRCGEIIENPPFGLTGLPFSLTKLTFE